MTVEMKFRWLFTYLIFAIACVGPIGCGEPEETQCISGKLVDVHMFHDGALSGVVLKFEDGRVQRVRLQTSNSVPFQLGVHNEITINHRGIILSVEITPGVAD